MAYKICADCFGAGKKKCRLRKKKSFPEEVKPFHGTTLLSHRISKKEPPFKMCTTCTGSGLAISTDFALPDNRKFPTIAIIGAGIGGVALAVACLHRGIPFTLFERDLSFDSRTQGYGLTLQQASKIISGFGIKFLKNGITSKKHIVHTTNGEIIAEWGMKKWLGNNTNPLKKSNIHIARQSLRKELVDQLSNDTHIQWGHKLIDFKTTSSGTSTLFFNVNNKTKIVEADVIVGADGIRSTVRDFIIKNNKTPLQYLGCIVILGICKLDTLTDINNELLNLETVFQTANGTERIYVMPFDAQSIMWQLSFQLNEETAKELSNKGADTLKKEAINRTNWHTPIPEIIANTSPSLISGYPVYDREILTTEMLKQTGNVTLIGDAAHPMSPFKGQGANQALLDALSLARIIYKTCNSNSNWCETDVKSNILTVYEKEMLQRSAKKVEDSAEAAQFLHSEIVLRKTNQPRGNVLKND